MSGSRPYITFGAPQIGDSEVAEVSDCVRSGWLGTGPRVAQFEAEFAEYKGVPPEHVLAVNSCTAALHISMIAARLEPGSEVITTPLTFCATVNAIIHAGLKPVLADINPETQNIDPDAVLAAVPLGVFSASVLLGLVAAAVPLGVVAAAVPLGVVAAAVPLGVVATELAAVVVLVAGELVDNNLAVVATATDEAAAAAAIPKVSSGPRRKLVIVSGSPVAVVVAAAAPETHVVGKAKECRIRCLASGAVPH